MKKHKDAPSVQAMSIWLTLMQHRSQESVESLFNFLKIMETIQEDDYVPLIVASAFKSLGRTDKAAEPFRIFGERFGRIMYYEQYFDYIVRALKFEEAAKVASKLYQLEKNLVNKYRLCIATFIHAASKETSKDREMSMKFASMLATKLFTDSEDSSFLKEFVEQIKKQTSSREMDRFVFHPFSHQIITKRKKPTGFDAFQKCLRKINQYENFVLVDSSEETLNEKLQAQEERLKALRLSYATNV